MRQQLVFVLLLCIAFLQYQPCTFARNIKQPNVAGQFYIDNPQSLKEQLDGFIEKATPPDVDGDIFALLSPHAGYQFSGQTAAFGYKLIKNQPYKTVIVIGPSHHYAFLGVSVYPEGVFRTPLGDIEVDAEFSAKLLNKDVTVRFDPRAFTKEHSVEVQLPFLQRVLTDFKIVPVVMGECSFDDCKSFSALMKSAIGQRKDVLVVASTDLYHGFDFRAAKDADLKTLSYIKQMNADELFTALKKGKAQLCGGLPVVSTMLLSCALGYRNALVLHYTNSAEVTRNMQEGAWTVGYASCAIDRQKGAGSMLNQSQKKELLSIARSSIESYLGTGKKMTPQTTDPLLLEEMGAFVTLHEKGLLRGCIGNLVGKGPLYLTVRDMAVEAAVRDPRFPPVETGELTSIEIEISVLSPMKRIDSANEIELGIHGVLVRKGFNSGVFLPQVATETGWTKEEFLDNLCSHKAGLNPRAWKDKSTELYVFTAEVFSEKDSSL